MSLQKDILTLARHRIERDWVKGEFGSVDSDNGSVCAIGAMWWAADKLGVDRGESLEYQKARALLDDCIPEEFPQEVMYFNDSLRSEKSDILQMFDCAIEKVEG